jgi:hypothetical protein
MPFARGLGVREHDRGRWVQVDRGGSRLGHECAAVEQEHAPVGSLDDEGSIERRGKPQRDLDLAGTDERREAAARVAAVRRVERPTVSAREDDLHRGSLAD